MSSMQIHKQMLSRLKPGGVAAAMLLTLSCGAEAALITYDITGSTSVGGSPHSFTGVFVYDNAVPGSTVYRPGQTAPVQQGFTTTYTGAVQSLSITLDNGESVSGGTGAIYISNIQQAENGAQVPEGLSLQAFPSGVAGTINGLQIINIYLAFLSVPPNFTWDGLDLYFSGNSENMLEGNPGLLPTTIDPFLTGTNLPGNLLDVFTGGVFLGTNHAQTNTVNLVSSMSIHVASGTPTMGSNPVPEPATLGLLLGGMGLLGWARGRKA